MSDMSWHEQAARRVMPLQIIVVALVLGCIVVPTVLLTVLQPRQIQATTPPVITWTAFAFFGAIVLARLIVPALTTAKGRRAILHGTFQIPGNRAMAEPPADLPADVYQLILLFQQKMIVGAAPLEGCAFFMAIAYGLERNPITLVLMILLILGVAAHFPTASRFIGWIEDQRTLLEQERQFAR